MSDKLHPKLSLVFKLFNSDGELFDYKKNESLTVIHETSKECFYYCKIQGKNNIINSEKHYNIQSNCDILFRARKSKNHYYEIINPIHTSYILDLNNIEQLDKKMWLVLTSEEEDCKYENLNAPYYLQQNDIIKIGQKKYEIIEKNIVNSKEQNPSTQNVNRNRLNKGKIFTETIDNEKIRIFIDNENSQNKSSENFSSGRDCRICFSGGATKEDPLLKLCDCQAIIHLSCLKKLFKDKVIIKENLSKTVTSYIWEKFNCEVCRKPYSSKYIYGDETYYLIDYIKPPKETNYIILESLPFIDTNNNNRKNIYVVKLTGEDVKIGRSDKNDIIDSELTVSRFHGILKFDKENGTITIINKGTFGILVLIQDNVKLEIGQKIYFQVGKVYIKAEVSNDIPEEKEDKDLKYEQKDLNGSFSENSFDSNKTQTNSLQNNSKEINIYI